MPGDMTEDQLAMDDRVESSYHGVCPTCRGYGGQHGGHCPNHGKPEHEWTTHEERVAQREVANYELVREPFARWLQEIGVPQNPVSRGMAYDALARHGLRITRR